MSLEVIVGEDIVSLGLDVDRQVSAFLDVYVDDPDMPSPFRTIDDAKDFVIIIKKLLEAVHDFK